MATQGNWPPSLSDQVQAIKSVLDAFPTPPLPAAIARNFKRARRDRVEEILSTLERLGQAVHEDKGRYFAA